MKFTEIYFEEGECFKHKLSIIVEGLDELFQAISDFARLGIVKWKATLISPFELTAYQRACKKAKIPIVLEKRRRLFQMRHSEFYMGKVVRKNDIT